MSLLGKLRSLHDKPICLKSNLFSLIVRLFSIKLLIPLLRFWFHSASKQMEFRKMWFPFQKGFMLQIVNSLFLVQEHILETWPDVTISIFYDASFVAWWYVCCFLWGLEMETVFCSRKGKRFCCGAHFPGQVLIRSWALRRDSSNNLKEAKKTMTFRGNQKKSC